MTIRDNLEFTQRSSYVPIMPVFVCVAGDRAVLQIEVFGLAWDAVYCLLTFLSSGLLLVDLACTCCLPEQSITLMLLGVVLLLWGPLQQVFFLTIRQKLNQNLFDLLGLTVFGLHRFRAEVLGFLEE